MVRIGIIDSGLNVPDDFRERIVGRVYIKKENGQVITTDETDLTDHWGHGTTCFRLVNAQNQNFEYLIVKIFEENYSRSDSNLLSAAINYCTDNGADLINMSLGIEGYQMPDDLVKACDNAHSKGVIMVAAAHNYHELCYPAYYPKVIGVGSFFSEDPDAVYYAEKSPIAFYASGADLSNNTQMHATSFSCARIAGKIAAIIEKNGKIPVAAVKKELSANAIPIRITSVLNNDDGHYHETMSDISNQVISQVAERHIIREKKFAGMHKVLLVSVDPRENIFRKIPSRILENGFEIVAPSIGRDPDVFTMGWLDNEENEKAYDTVALGNLNAYINSPLREQVIACLKQFIVKKKQFIFFDKKSRDIVNQLEHDFPEANLRKYFPEIDSQMFREISRFKYLPSVSVPVVAVLSAGRKDITYLQVYLKKILEKQHNRVSYISTNRYAELAEACFAFPYTELGTSRLSSKEKILLLRYLLKGVQHFCTPDFILAGIKSAALPATDRLDFAWNDVAAFLYGVNPDGLIIHADNFATDTELEQTVLLATAITRVPVLCFLSGPGREINTRFVKRVKNWRSCRVIQLGTMQTDRQISEILDAFFGKKIPVGKKNMFEYYE